VFSLPCRIELLTEKEDDSMFDQFWRNWLLTQGEGMILCGLPCRNGLLTHGERVILCLIYSAEKDCLLRRRECSLFGLSCGKVLPASNG